MGLQMLDQSSEGSLRIGSRAEAIAGRRNENERSGTRSETPKVSRLPDWIIESSVVMAGVAVGIATGAAVKLFRYAVLQLKIFTYAGPWFQVVSCIKANIAPLVPFTLVGVKPEVALLPLLGGLITWALIKTSKGISGNAPGPALAGHLEDLQMGKDADYRRVGFRKLGMVSALGTGNSLGPVRCEAA